MVDELRIPIDPCNPGQFFACCGLLELAATRSPDTLARFEVSARVPRSGQFVLTGCEPDKIGCALDEIRAAECAAADAGKGVEDSIAPVALGIGGRPIVLDWWLDEFRQEATQLKCWAGNQTSIKILRDLVPQLPAAALEQLMGVGVMSSTRLGVDPRSAWLAADVGYSPNEHQQEAMTFPAVEVLAAVGLQGFRPGGERRSRSYALWGEALPCPVCRLACCEPWEGLRTFEYRFEITGRGSYKFFGFASPYGRTSR